MMARTISPTLTLTKATTEKEPMAKKTFKEVLADEPYSIYDPRHEIYHQKAHKGYMGIRPIDLGGEHLIITPGIEGEYLNEEYLTEKTDPAEMTHTIIAYDKKNPHIILGHGNTKAEATKMAAGHFNKLYQGAGKPKFSYTNAGKSLIPHLSPVSPTTIKWKKHSTGSGGVAVPIGAKVLPPRPRTTATTKSAPAPASQQTTTNTNFHHPDYHPGAHGYVVWHPDSGKIHGAFYMHKNALDSHASAPSGSVMTPLADGDDIEAFKSHIKTGAPKPGIFPNWSGYPATGIFTTKKTEEAPAQQQSSTGFTHWDAPHPHAGGYAIVHKATGTVMGTGFKHEYALDKLNYLTKAQKINPADHAIIPLDSEQSTEYALDHKIYDQIPKYTQKPGGLWAVSKMGAEEPEPEAPKAEPVKAEPPKAEPPKAQFPTPGSLQVPAPVGHWGAPAFTHMNDWGIPHPNTNVKWAVMGAHNHPTKAGKVIQVSNNYDAALKGKHASGSPEHHIVIPLQSQEDYLNAEYHHVFDTTPSVKKNDDATWNISASPHSPKATESPKAEPPKAEPPKAEPPKAEPPKAPEPEKPTLKVVLPTKNWKQNHGQQKGYAIVDKSTGIAKHVRHQLSNAKKAAKALNSVHGNEQHYVVPLYHYNDHYTINSSGVQLYPLGDPKTSLWASEKNHPLTAKTDPPKPTPSPSPTPSYSTHSSYSPAPVTPVNYDSHPHVAFDAKSGKIIKTGSKGDLGTEFSGHNGEVSVIPAHPSLAEAHKQDNRVGVKVKNGMAHPDIRPHHFVFLKDHSNHPEEREIIKKTGDYISQLTHGERAGIHSYTGNSYSAYNSALWQGGAPPKNWQEINDGLNKGKLDDESFMWSGIRFDPSKIPVNKKFGKKIQHYAAFSSASLNLQTAYSFSDKDILQLQMPKGMRGMYVESISQNKPEKEFVLPVNHILHIHPHPIGQYMGKRIWHARVINDGTNVFPYRPEELEPHQKS
jgi:hypothetical protein